MQSNRRRIYIITGLIALLVLSVFIVSKVDTRSSQAMNLEQIHLPGPLSSVVGNKPDTVIFSNGRYFVQYNYRSGTSVALSRDTEMPIINNLQRTTGNRFLIFRSSNHAFNSPFAPILKREDLPFASAYWWAFDMTKKQFYLLGDGSNIIVANRSENFYHRAINTETEGVIETKAVADIPTAEHGEYTAPPKEPVQPLNVGQPVRSFFPIGLSYKVETMNGTVFSIDDKGNKVTELSESRNLGVSASGRYATINNLVDERDEEIFLHMIDLDKNSNQRLGDFHESFTLWLSGSDTVLYKVDKDDFITSETVNEKSVKLVVANEDEKDIFSLLQLSNEVGSGVYVGSVEFRHFYIVSDSALFDITSPKGYSVRLKNNTTIEYVDEYDRFIVNIVGKVKSVNKRQAYNTLRAAGFNPDIYQVEFVGTDYVR